MRTASPKHLLLALSAAGLVGLGLAPSCGTSSASPADLLLLYTGNVHGYIEPCGCVAGQIGGIDRIARYVRTELAANPRGLFIETGDLFASVTDLEPPKAQQLPIKARAFLRVWADLGCEAMALGENDLALGIDFLEELRDESGVPMLCGNLVDANGETPFPGSRIVERDGLRIGIFSVIAGKLQEPDKESKQTVDVRALVAEQGHTLQPWLPVAERLAAELRAECDVVVFASHVGFDRNKSAAANLDVDVVVGGHAGSATVETTFIGNTPVLVSFLRGARVGRAEWWWPDEGEYFLDEGHGPLEDVSQWLGARVGIQVEQDSYDDLEGREAGMGTKKWNKKRAHHRQEMLRNQHSLEALGKIPTVNRFSHVLVPMHFAIGRDETALEAVDDYHDELHAFWTDKGGEPVDSELYVGADACADCHPRQYDFWRATRHSYAFATLQATQQEVDAECIGCHTVGYRQPDGFNRPDRYAGFRERPVRRVPRPRWAPHGRRPLVHRQARHPQRHRRVRALPRQGARPSVRGGGARAPAARDVPAARARGDGLPRARGHLPEHGRAVDRQQDAVVGPGLGPRVEGGGPHRLDRGSGDLALRDRRRPGAPDARTPLPRRRPARGRAPALSRSSRRRVRTTPRFGGGSPPPSCPRIRTARSSTRSKRTP